MEVTLSALIMLYGTMLVMFHIWKGQAECKKMWMIIWQLNPCLYLHLKHASALCEEFDACPQRKSWWVEFLIPAILSCHILPNRMVLTANLRLLRNTWESTIVSCNHFGCAMCFICIDTPSENTVCAALALEQNAGMAPSTRTADHGARMNIICPKTVS